MNSLKTVKILLSPLRLHSASSIQIHQSTNRYNSMFPSDYVSPLKLHSATKMNLHGVSDSALVRNHLKVRLSPLKSSVLRVGSHVVFAWIHCTHVRIHCTDILIECR